jgi:hypothetical protein
MAVTGLDKRFMLDHLVRNRAGKGPDFGRKTARVRGFFIVGGAR